MIEDFLKRHNTDEQRLAKWLKSNGIDLHIAIDVLRIFEWENKTFLSGKELQEALLKECQKREIEPIKEFMNNWIKKESQKGIIERVKKWFAGEKSES